MKNRTFSTLAPLLAVLMVLMFGATPVASAQATVSIDPAVTAAWKDMQLKANPRYISLKIGDDSAVVVEKSFDTSVTYDDFISSFPEKEPRYYVANFQYSASDGQPRSARLFFLWIPDGSSLKAKMHYTSAKVTVKNALDGIGREIQGAEKADFAYESVQAIAAK